jgi:hypothetical protein
MRAPEAAEKGEVSPSIEILSKRELPPRKAREVAARRIRGEQGETKEEEESKAERPPVTIGGEEVDLSESSDFDEAEAARIGRVVVADAQEALAKRLMAVGKEGRATPEPEERKGKEDSAQEI